MPRQKQPKQAIAYIRVSTRQQALSGVGREGQRAVIEELARALGYIIIDIFEDVASGAKSPSERPGLREALAQSRQRDCPILVADLSRLSRSVAVVQQIAAEGKLNVLSPDMAGSHIVIRTGAARAEAELKRITERAIEGAARAKAGGKKLGNPKIEDAREKANASRAQKALESDARLTGLFDEARQAGARTDKAVADYLNGRKEMTRQGHAWTEGNVRRARLKLASNPKQQTAAADTANPNWGIF